MNYFVGILNVKMITLKEKEFGCEKFQWKDTRKENFMFWFRSWSYLIRSSFSSCPFLLNSLFCFVIGCIQQFHCLIILPNNFFGFAVELFSTPKREKQVSSTRERNYCVLRRCDCAKFKIFLSVEKFWSALRSSVRTTVINF